MREFVVPFKPEELLAEPSDDRLWAENLPDVDSWSFEEAGAALDALIGRILSTHGRDVAEAESFSLIFATLQGWQRLDEGVRPRIADLLVDAARRLVPEVGRLKKQAGKSDQRVALGEVRTVAKVLSFFLKWASERLMRQPASMDAMRPRGGNGKGAGKRGAKKGAGADEGPTAEEIKDAQKASERQRCVLLSSMADLFGKGAMSWLWEADTGSWQQVAQSVSDAGFLVLDSEQMLKHRETRQTALRCITEPLLQQGHDHSTLLVGTVSRLTHGLRGGEFAAPFAADALLLAQTSTLPRLFLVELMHHCTSAESLTGQGPFQRALAAFLVALGERMPHLALSNISVLLPILDVDCYPLRSAVVECVGTLLMAEGKAIPNSVAARSSCQDDGAVGQVAESSDMAIVAVAPKEECGEVAVPATGFFTVPIATRKDLVDMLITRSHDKTSWVRQRVLQTFLHLASNRRVAVLPRDRWPEALELATDRMQDCACSVRKAAVQLARILIQFHPYGPALSGSGDETAKADRLLRVVAKKLKELDVAENLEALAAMVIEKVKEEGDADAEMGVPATADEPDGDSQDDESVNDASESQAKRRRFNKKTVPEVTPNDEVDKCLEEEAGAGAARDRQRQVLKRMRDCYIQRVRFVELLDTTEARLKTLMASRTPSDVCEAVGVVVELRLRGLPLATRAFNQVLGLVWSLQEPIKESAVKAFHRMHLEGRDQVEVVRTLLEMYQNGCAEAGGWTYTHLASVQELLQQTASQDLLDISAVVPELVSALSGPSCCMALRALTAVVGKSVGELTKALPKLSELFCENGAALVGTTPSEELERVRLLGELLMRIHSGTKVPLQGDAWIHLWGLSQRVTHMVVGYFTRAELPAEWFSAAQIAVDLTFELASSATAESELAQQCPDKLWEQILSRMTCAILGQPQDGLAPGLQIVAAEPPLGTGDGDDQDTSNDAHMSDVDSEVQPVLQKIAEVATPQLSCVLFLAGHIALKMLVFLEGLQSSLKKKRMADEDARIAEAKKAKGKNKTDEGADASSMGQAGQDERDADAFAELAENDLLYKLRGLLSQLKPLVHAGLMDPKLRGDAVIRRLSAISLCKFMTVSKRFCEENLQLLFSMLFPRTHTSGGCDFPPLQAAIAPPTSDATCSVRPGVNPVLEDLTLRQSLLVAVGDLLFRHPNVVEPWSDRLYAALGAGDSEAAIELRLNALLVLTHLVLNDMMKPRAVLLVKALWLTACTHPSTARVARILFQELSKRSSNVIYNLLPEVIARLSDPLDTGTSGADVAGSAASRVRYIMQFVEKEKHVEGLIEKFAIRLTQSTDLAGSTVQAEEVPGVIDPAQPSREAKADGTADPERAALTVHCLSVAVGSMNYGDKSIMRLHDVVVVRRILNTAISFHKVVAENLLSIVEKARKKKNEKTGDKGGPAADGSAAPEPAGNSAVEAGGGGGAKGEKSAAVVAALDAIEKLVIGLAEGKGSSEDQPPPMAPGPAPIGDTLAPASDLAMEGSADAPIAKVGKNLKRKKETEPPVPVPAESGKAGKRKGAGGAKENVEPEQVNAKEGDEALLGSIAALKGSKPGRGKPKASAAQAIKTERVGAKKAVKRRRTAQDDEDYTD